MLKARTSAPSLRLDAAAQVQRIVNTLEYQPHTQLRRRGFIVAMSGGVDSSVCAALAAQLVTVSSMPSETSHGVVDRNSLGDHGS